MTGRQLGMLVILAVLLLLVVSVMLVFALGLFDVSLAPVLPTEPSTRSAGELEGTPSPGDRTSLPPSSTLSFQGTETPSPISTVYTSTPATQIATPVHTLTPPADICAQLDLRFLSATSNIAAWRLQNDSGTTLTISRIELDWPKSNDAIFNAFLNGKVIWSGVDLTSPTIMTTWIGNIEDRSVDGLTRVEFFFGTLAKPSGYDLHLWFENGCEVSAVN